uniref:NfeD family protein n=1 Tax=Ndongobacter massiliensis TaxID=1871025 RepID=UPI0009303358|nr:NfeD family protein [Ndongobacter massiliensis]
MQAFLSTFNQPWMLGLLLFIGFAAVIVEFFLPTAGIAVVVAVAAFGLYFAAGLQAGYANAVTLLLFLGGVLLLLVEVTTAGFGLSGIVGMLLVFTGLVFSSQSAGIGLITLFGAIAFSVLIGALLVRLGYRSRFMKRSVLDTQLTTARGYTGKTVDATLVGKTGIAKTALRPVGEALIEGQVVEVITQGEFIPKGSTITVFKTENAQLFVRR